MDETAVALITDLEKRLELLERRPNERGSKLAAMYAGFSGLPALRGLWYPGIATEAGSLPDQSGEGRTLTYTGNPTINLHDNMVPYYDYDGTGDCHVRADEAGLDLLGTEAYVAAALRGWTIGTWFWVDAAAPIAGLMSKWSNVVADQAYMLRYTGANAVQVGLGSGAASTTLNSTVTIANGAWYFGVGRFTPASELAIFVNNAKTSTATAVAAAGGGAAQFELARLNAINLQNLDGRIAIAFIAACAFPDALIAYLFNHSRQLFGV